MTEQEFRAAWDEIRQDGTYGIVSNGFGYTWWLILAVASVFLAVVLFENHQWLLGAVTCVHAAYCVFACYPIWSARRAMDREWIAFYKKHIRSQQS